MLPSTPNLVQLIWKCLYIHSSCCIVSQPSLDFPCLNITTASFDFKSQTLVLGQCIYFKRSEKKQSFSKSKIERYTGVTHQCYLLAEPILFAFYNDPNGIFFSVCLTFSCSTNQVSEWKNFPFTTQCKSDCNDWA